MTLIRITERSGLAGSCNAIVSFDNADEFTATVSDPFTQDEERRLEWYYEAHLRMPFLDDVKARQAADSVTAYGEALFRQIFADPNALLQYRQAAQAGLSRLSFEVVGSPEFHRFHWEALRDSHLKKYLALEATLVRRTPGSQNYPATPQPSPTINVLVVTARPGYGEDVSYRTISRPLVEALGQAAVPVEIDIVRPATYRALHEHLEATRDLHGEGYYHVIHFDMHGALLTYEQLKRGGESNRFLFDARWGRNEVKPYGDTKAYVFFVSAEHNAEGHRSDPVEAGELADLLLAHKIPIAILNACQSGKQVGASETSLGSRLMQAGMQMVIAMSYSVTVTAAERMMKTLYTELLAKQGLAVAVRRARQELFGDKSRRAYFGYRVSLEDWLLPVVYQHRELNLQTRDFRRDEQKVHFERRAQRYASSEAAYRRPEYGFFGRDLDILHIETRLLTGRNLLLIRGMGGAGKTTLLHHLADWWQTTHLVEKVCYFGYDAQAWTLPQILHAIARQLFPDEYDYDTRFKPLVTEMAQQQLLVDKLRSERHLLILDNLESITGNPLSIRNTLPEAEQEKLRRFLAALAGGKSLVLLGSRSGEEWLARDTFAANLYDLGGLDPEAASQLAETILIRQGTTKYRQEDDFRRLLKLLAGYPLALEVVLSNLTRQTPTEIVSALEAGDVSLDRGNAQDKTESILRCIDYSHSNLSPETQNLLLCLAPFTGVLCPRLLEQYSQFLRAQPALAYLPYERWPEVVQEAAKWGLLNPHPEIEGYLQLQPTLPYFLRNRLNAPGQEEQREAIQTAFRQQYDEVSKSITRLLASNGAHEHKLGQALAHMEYENLTTALDLALAAQVSCWELRRVLSRFLDVLHDEQRGLQLSEMILARLESYPPETLTGSLYTGLISVLDDIGGRQMRLNRLSEAEESYQKALAFHLAHKNISSEEIRRMSAGIYHQLGRVAQEQRQWLLAEQRYSEALRICVEFNNRQYQAEIYHNLAVIAQSQRLWAKSQEYYKLSLDIRIEFNNRRAQSSSYHNLGVLAYQQNKLDEAHAAYIKALEIDVEFNDLHSQASTYHQLGLTAQKQQQWDLANQYLGLALRIYIEVNDRYPQADTYHQLGRGVEEQKQWEQANAYYQQALQIKIDFNDHYSQASTYGQLGLLAREQHQWRHAQDYLLKCLTIFVEFQDQYQVNITLGHLALLWPASGDAELPNAIAAVLRMEVAVVEEGLRGMVAQDKTPEDHLDTANT